MQDLEDLIEEAEAFLRDKKPTQRRKVMGHKVGTLVCLRVTNICSKPDKLL